METLSTDTAIDEELLKPACPQKLIGYTKLVLLSTNATLNTSTRNRYGRHPDGFPISGYPSFNSPDCMVDSILSVPFNLVNFATNHTYDMGTFGVERSHEIFN